MNKILVVLSLSVLSVTTALLPVALVHASEADPLRAVLQQSHDDKNGITLVVDGRDVALVVTEIGKDFVVGKSQQHERIVVRIDQIDAALK